MQSEPRVTAGELSHAAPLPSLVGRDSDVLHVVRLLRDERARLLTLTGTGGVGKTRLALAAVAQLEGDFSDGIRFISLVPIHDAEDVLPAIAQTLDLHRTGSQQVEDLLQQALRNREQLLVLDNVEQVIDAAPSLASLLTHCPRLQILVTSRMPLHLSFEQEFPVEPLELPDAAASTPAAIVSNPAVELFVERVRAFQPHFHLDDSNAGDIAEICRRLDGLPLAIELAAARVRILQPHGLLARLDQRLLLLTDGPRDAPERQRTLRDTIAWSYALLTPEQQHLVRTLSVFGNGCSLDVLIAVLATEERDVLNEIMALQRSSLIRIRGDGTRPTRVWMLETIREFGLEQLQEHGELGAAYDTLYAYIIEHGWRVFTVDYTRRLELDIDEIGNMRHAFQHASRKGHIEAVLSSAGALAVYWFLLGARNPDTTEGITSNLERNWPGGGHDEAFDIWASNSMDDTANRSDSTTLALWTVAWIAANRGDYARARQITEFCVKDWTARGLQHGAAIGHFYLGVISTDFGKYEAAESEIRIALRMLRSVRDNAWIPHPLYVLGMLLYHRGERDEALQYFQEALHLFASSGSELLPAGPLGYLARIERDRGNLPGALRYHLDALRRRARHRDHFGVATNVRGIAGLALADRQPEIATQLYGAATALRAGIEPVITPHAASRYERTLTGLRETLGDAGFERLWLDGAALDLDEIVSLASSVHIASRAGSRDSATCSTCDDPGLTPREREVLGLMAGGLTFVEISERLFISPRTVSTHATNIYGKLGVNSHFAAAAYAYKHGLVAAEDHRT